MKYVLAFGLLLLACAEAAHAQEPRGPGTGAAVEATVGNNVLQLRYLAPSPWTNLPSDLDYGLLLSENRNIIASAAMMFDTNIHVIPNLVIDVGPQGYLADLTAEHKTNVFAAALGADVRYEIIPRWGIAAFGGAFFSPGVLTFGNAHNLYDFTAGAEVRFTTRLIAVAGYRWLKVTTVDEPDVNVQNEVFAGLRWRLR